MTRSAGLILLTLAVSVVAAGQTVLHELLHYVADTEVQYATHLDAYCYVAQLPMIADEHIWCERVPPALRRDAARLKDFTYNQANVELLAARLRDALESLAGAAISARPLCQKLLVMVKPPSDPLEWSAKCEADADTVVENMDGIKKALEEARKNK